MSKKLYKKWWVKLLAVLIIFPISFISTDYYLRGYLYYTKLTINTVYADTWQKIFPPSGTVNCFLKVVVDQDYRKKYPDWKTHVTDLVKDVDNRFFDEFGIHMYILDISPWDKPDNLTEYSDILNYGVKNINRGSADILVIMTGEGYQVTGGSHWADIGIASFLGNCVVVGEDSQLMHELGHLFGAVDYPKGDPNFDTISIYSYKYLLRTRHIDPMNHERIMAHKYRLLW